MERIDIRVEKKSNLRSTKLERFSQYLLALNKTWHLLPNNNNNILRFAYFLIFPTIVEIEFRTPTYALYWRGIYLSQQPQVDLNFKQSELQNSCK